MKLLSKVVLAAYLLILVWLVLFKFSLDASSALDHQIRNLNLIPFAYSAADSLWHYTMGIIFNFVAFTPLGLLLSVNFKQAVFGRKLAFVFIFSLVAEVIQFVFAIGTSDITDVITNTSGGLLGLTLYDLGKKYIDHKRLDRFIIVASTVLLILFILFRFLVFKVDYQSAPHKDTLIASAETVSPRVALAKNIQFDWPAVGQAAVGSVEDGLLARSSDNEEPRPTASMAKVITALAIMEKQPFELGQTGKTYTLTSKDVENYHTEVARGGSLVPVHAGMVLTQYQAMQMMLIASSNNIADTLVERIFGSSEAYESYAQDMLQRKGLSRTVVADASGFSPATVSTPSELVIIGIAALKNPVIAEIVAQPQAAIPGVGVIKNTNELLGTGGVGIKTGTTDEAGSCLLFAARYSAENGQEVTIVGVIMGSSMNSTSLFSDSRALLASVKQGLNLIEAPPASSVVTPSEHGDRVPRQ